MDQKNFSIKLIGQNKDVIQILFQQGSFSRNNLSELNSFFAKKISEGAYKWVFDFTNMPFPTTTFIAFLISATQQVREYGGDLKIIHTQDSTRNNFITFSPLTYLAIEDNVTNSLEEFDIELNPNKNRQTKSIPKEDMVVSPVAEKMTESKNEQEKTASTTTENHQEKPIEKSKPIEKRPRISNKKTPLIEPQLQNNQPQKFYLKTESIASNLYKICDFVVEHSRNAGLEEKQIVKSKIAVYEACLNVIEHAYHSRPDNWIEVWVEYDHEKFQIVIQDFGLSFEKNEPDEFDAEEAAEKRQTGGFGIHIIERSMDEVSYKADAINGNQLTLIKYLK